MKSSYSSWLGKANGIFSLTDSDRFVGSYISKKDVLKIMGVGYAEIEKLSFKMIDGIEYIDEKCLRCNWKNGEIPNAPCYRCGRATSSLDELILVAIIKRNYPKAIVQRQYPWGTKRIDFYVKIQKKEFFIEFIGPGHFKKLGKIEEDYKRCRDIEKEFGKPCYLWPFWIQRCSLNFKILIGEEKEKSGRVALWSTKGFFSEFECKSSVILELTNQFRAVMNGNIGYGYDEWNSEDCIKPEHFIISDIISGKEDYHVLIPKDVPTEEEDKWLPSKVIEWKKNK